MNKYKRILLKISGEALLGNNKFGINFNILKEIISQIVEIKKMNIKIVLVIGAGNIWRARDNKDCGIERVYSDSIGMLGTVMNAVAMQSVFESMKIETRVCSAIDIPQLAEPYIRRRAMRHLDKDRIVISAGGTGNPYFTTDTTAALRALELNCDILLKASNVDGVYDSDPDKNKNAKKFDKLTFSKVLEKDFRVIDASAVSLCRDSSLPIMIFNLMKKGNIHDAVTGKNVGTLIS